VFILIGVIIYLGILRFAFRYRIIESSIVSEIHNSNLSILKIK